MRTRRLHAIAAMSAGLMLTALAGCGGNGGAGGDSFTIGLLLPSYGRPRFDHFDRPLIEKRLKELCAHCKVEYANAGDDAAVQRRQLDTMITKGASVLILDVVDPKALRSSVEAAHKSGIPVVAYDRLAQGPISGFVTFDGAQVGRLQGEALLKALGDKADHSQIVMMNGDPSGPNAEWFERGALSVLQGKVKIGKSYYTVDWQAGNAHANMSGAIASLGMGGIDGVLAANDSIATGVISALKTAHVTPLPPVTGQDADLEAVRRLVTGEQYMTVYKPFRDQAGAAAAMAVALGRGEDVGGIATGTIDSATTKDIPAVLLTPVSVTVRDIKDTLIKDGVYTIDQICIPKLRSACDKAGLT
ncbi:sugar ABC transporter substrate-binding protein [Streptomyces himalayensis]|uniref:Substrate-binding domain-containing protein n=1 Tax=Streptomyces himalayensis subsp. himalayensis TaxID=2756131 RepID=A0A7W0DTD8_9ACTN|nr:substrate-binding domain-containing protein [Streptomyces himalayensis subsp. himalayensis]